MLFFSWAKIHWTGVSPDTAQKLLTCTLNWLPGSQLLSCQLHPGKACPHFTGKRKAWRAQVGVGGNKAFWCPVPFQCTIVQSSPVPQFVSQWKLVPWCLPLLCQGWVLIRGKPLVDPGSGPRLLDEVRHVKVIKQTSKKKLSDITAKTKDSTIYSHSLVTPFSKEWSEDRESLVKSGLDLFI